MNFPVLPTSIRIPRKLPLSTALGSGSWPLKVVTAAHALYRHSRLRASCFAAFESRVLWSGVSSRIDSSRCCIDGIALVGGALSRSRIDREARDEIMLLAWALLWAFKAATLTCQYMKDRKTKALQTLHLQRGDFLFQLLGGRIMRTRSNHAGGSNEDILKNKYTALAYAEENSLGAVAWYERQIDAATQPTLAQSQQSATRPQGNPYHKIT